MNTPLSKQMSSLASCKQNELRLAQYDNLSNKNDQLYQPKTLTDDEGQGMTRTTIRGFIAQDHTNSRSDEMMSPV